MELLFDLDGTLTDAAPGITRCLRHALEGLGRPVPGEAELRSFVGPPLSFTFSQLLETEEEAPIAEAIALYRDRFAQVGLYENEVYPGVPELLEELRTEGHALRVVTSKPTVYASRIVAHFELDRHFREVHGSELSGERCDKVSLLAHVLGTASLDPERCVMIGDRQFDLAGARAHGLHSFGVTWGYGSEEELAGCDARASSPPELGRLIRDWATGA